MSSNHKKSDVQDRITVLEGEIALAYEYLETGAHAESHKFRPLFSEKMRDGERVPPHKDWIRKKYLPTREKALARAEQLIERFESDGDV